MIVPRRVFFLKKQIILIGSCIIIAALIIANQEIRSIIPVSIVVVANDSIIPKDVEDKSQVTRVDTEDTAPITVKHPITDAAPISDTASIPVVAPVPVTDPLPATAPKSKPLVPVPVDKVNSSTVFSQNKLFNYLSVEGNRQIVIQSALQLNNGQYTNACVYFVAEALRQNGVDTPVATCNTTGLIAQLEAQGWAYNSDYKNLQPGDICFTMDQNHGEGAPAHTYVFMGWVSPDNYDYAMICDNQADRYGIVYHKRNIVKLDVYKGEEKEAFHFFMRI